MAKDVSYCVAGEAVVNQAATVGAGEFIPYLYRPSYAGAAVSNRCRNISSEGFGADVVGVLVLVGVVVRGQVLSISGTS